jgi:hypothetical protein
VTRSLCRVVSILIDQRHFWPDCKHQRNLAELRDCSAITSSGSGIAEAGQPAMIAMASTRSAANRGRVLHKSPANADADWDEFRGARGIGDRQSVLGETALC